MKNRDKGKQEEEGVELQSIGGPEQEPVKPGQSAELKEEGVEGQKKKDEERTYFFVTDKDGRITPGASIQEFKKELSLVEKGGALEQSNKDINDLISKNEWKEGGKVQAIPGRMGPGDPGEPCMLIKINAKDDQELQEILTKFEKAGYKLVKLQEQKPGPEKTSPEGPATPGATSEERPPPPRGNSLR